jgi:plasmid stabilization system protein ParE
MPQVYWLKSARDDLAGIQAYYEDIGEPDVGQRIKNEVLDIERLLAHCPEMGVKVPNVWPTHRSKLVGNYRVIYRFDESVKVAAVIDTRQDFLSTWHSRRRT